MRLFGWLLSLPIFIGLVIFALQNRMQVSVSFWPFDAQATLPLSILSLGLLLVGFVMGSLVAGVMTFVSQLEIRRLRKENNSLKAKLEEKTPVFTGPATLYTGRYQPVSPPEKPGPVKKRRRWFGAKA